ncbi:hypothetical protein E2C01_030743 [Portunus trituberculatus]|uniref:Uncharacterized protein n=1 Tax=Portunus trituberculatus TaxID=210409 RepID=A0A5B7EW65_PORTR|nr:hypothetical protein [Portunus trituberculatus]
MPLGTSPLHRHSPRREEMANKLISDLLLGARARLVCQASRRSIAGHYEAASERDTQASYRKHRYFEGSVERRKLKADAKLIMIATDYEGQLSAWEVVGGMILAGILKGRMPLMFTSSARFRCSCSRDWWNGARAGGVLPVLPSSAKCL